MTRKFLLASDFDQTLSFNDSGVVLSELIGFHGFHDNFNVISAAPQEIVQSALEGIVRPDHIFGTRFRYNEATGEVNSIIRAAAGWGKITVLEELRADLGISHDHIIYMGDGSSDLPVMMHVNQYDGLTIAVSEAKFVSRVAKRTVLSANAMSVLVPVLERVMNWKSAEIRRFFASYGLTLLEWDRMHTDILTIQESGLQVAPLSDDHPAAPQLIAQ
jgi:hypothetical protein